MPRNTSKNWSCVICHLFFLYEADLHVHLANFESLISKQAISTTSTASTFCKRQLECCSLLYVMVFSHLDISVTRKMNQTTRYPPMIEQDRALASLVGSLPKLTSLDISGTHLAGQDEAETDNRCVVSGVFTLS